MKQANVILTTDLKLDNIDLVVWSVCHKVGHLQYIPNNKSPYLSILRRLCHIHSASHLEDATRRNFQVFAYFSQ